MSQPLTSAGPRALRELVVVIDRRHRHLAIGSLVLAVQGNYVWSYIRQFQALAQGLVASPSIPPILLARRPGLNTCHRVFQESCQRSLRVPQLPGQVSLQNFQAGFSPRLGDFPI